MKKTILLTILLTILSSMAWAQPYQSVFGSDSTKWIVHRFGMDSNFIEHIITIGKDSLIENIRYKKANFQTSPYDSEYRHDDFYMREDTLTGKLWLYEAEKNKEHLIMDLSLNKADSFFLPTWVNETVGIEAFMIVDSVAIIKNKKHIYFNTYIFSNHHPVFEFIEGVGSNAGPLFLTEENEMSRYFNVNMNNLLLCKFNDSVHLYNDTSNTYGSCHYAYVGLTNKLQLTEFSVYPNPASDYLTVRFLEKTIGTLSIYNLSGSRLYVKQVQEETTVIPLIGYNPGIYSIVFVGEKHSYSQYFIIN